MLAIAVSKDKHWLVSGGQDQSARLWDLTLDVPARKVIGLRGHKDAVTHTAITPDGKLAVSASADKTLKIWEIEAKDPSVSGVTFKGHEDGSRVSA